MNTNSKHIFCLLQKQFYKAPTLGVFLLLVFGSCVRNEWAIDDQRASNDGSLQQCVIYFNPRLESNYTKALTLFPADCKAQVFAFISGEGSQSITSPVYQSLKAGTLSPTRKPMVLPVGTYDFYAVSSKMDSLPPTFIDNEATSLQNGVDYLWCEVEGKNIFVNGTVVDLTFNHSATQFVFNFVYENNAVKVDSVVYAAMGIPTPSDDAKWNLVSGKISQIEGLPNDIGALNVSGDNQSMNLVCLPFYSNQPNALDAMIIKENDSIKFFNVKIPVPENGYLSGRSYQYEIVFAPDTIMLGNIKVAPWIENDEGNIYVPF